MIKERITETDPEIRAMRRIWRELEGLEPDRQRTVVFYILGRIEKQLKIEELGIAPLTAG